MTKQMNAAAFICFFAVRHQNGILRAVLLIV